MEDISRGYGLMRILLLDIETAPNKVYTWGLWDQQIATNQVQETSYILCWAAKWYGEEKIMFDSVKKSSAKAMIGKMHTLLDQASIVVHYNGVKFDIPTLNKEFIQLGFAPPAPYKQVDCLREVKRMFRFQSNKLDFVAQALDIGAKASHEGFELWIKCMDKKDPDHEGAWKRMEKYNRQDVKLLETLYTRLRPWIDRHPNVATEEDIMGCPKCGSQKYTQQGYRTTSMLKYPRYQCQACGGWFRGNKTVSHRRGERAANIV